MECDFGKKANNFNKFLASNCTPRSNGSTLTYFLSNIPTVELSLELNDHDILKIIRALKIQKAHDSDDNSLYKIKICDQSIVNTTRKDKEDLGYFRIFK